MSLPERKRAILKSIVENYIRGGEPIGSKSLSVKLAESLSSATIRNEMSELEDMGYLEKPHVSAGRVPSPQAYRFYVDELMSHYLVTANEVGTLQADLSKKIGELDNIIINASKIVSEMTNYAGISFTRRINGQVISQIRIIPVVDIRSYAVVAVTNIGEVKSKTIFFDTFIDDADIDALANSINMLLREHSSKEVFDTIARMLPPHTPLTSFTHLIFKFICEVQGENFKDDIHIDGTERLLSHPEFWDISKARRVLDYLAVGSNLNELAQTPSPEIVKIKIGPHTDTGALDDAAFVFTTYQMSGGMQGVIGIVGPTRMDYASVSQKLETFALTLGKTLPINFEQGFNTDINMEGKWKKH